METKVCTKCKEIKTVDLFSKRSASKDGLIAHCKFCDKNYQKKYRNLDKWKDYHKEYRLSDKFKESIKNYKQSDKFKESTQKYNKSDKGIEYSKKGNEKYMKSDKYFKNRLKRKGFKDEDITQDLIYQQRQIIETNRLITKINKYETSK